MTSSGSPRRCSNSTDRDDALAVGSPWHRLDERLAGRPAVRHRRRRARRSWRRRRRARSASGAAPADAELDHLRQAEVSGRVDRRLAGRAGVGARRARCPRRRRSRRRAARRRRRRRRLGRSDRRRHGGDRRPAMGATRRRTRSNPPGRGAQRVPPAHRLHAWRRPIGATTGRRPSSSSEPRRQPPPPTSPTSSTSTSPRYANNTAVARPSSRSSTRPGCDRPPQAGIAASNSWV